MQVPHGGHACDRVCVCARESDGVGAEGPAWPEAGWCMAGDGCVAGIWVRDCGGTRGGRSLLPLPAPPIHMDAKTFSYFIFLFFNDVSKAIPSFCEIQAR